MSPAMSQRLRFIFSVILPAIVTSQCIYESSDLESSVFEDPQYGNLNIDNLEDAFFPTNDRESLAVDILYEFIRYPHGPHQNKTFLWAWSPITLFIYPLDFKFLSLFTVTYVQESCTVYIAMPVCGNVSEENIEDLLDGFTQAVRGYIVDGYSSKAGRKIDNHQIGYSTLLDDNYNTSFLFVFLLIGAIVSAFIPYLYVIYKQCLMMDCNTQCCSQQNGYKTLRESASKEDEATNKEDGAAKTEKEDEAWTFGLKVVMGILAVYITVVEGVHTGYVAYTPHLAIIIVPLFVCLGCFLFNPIGACLCALYRKMCKQTDKPCKCLLQEYIAKAIWICGIQLLLFHVPFIGLGLSSLPFQATITIGTYVSVIIVIVTGISLAKYEYLLLDKCSWSQFFIVISTFLAALMITMLSVVDILITHYFHSTADISQTPPSQIFNSLLSITVSTAFSVTVWKKHLFFCEIIKGWVKKKKNATGIN